MKYICLEDAQARLMEIRETYIDEHKFAIAGACKECANALENLPRKEPEVKKITELPETTRTVAVEPWYPGALTGRDVWRCGFCTTQVDRKDKYCRFCGRKLVDKQ